MFTFDDWQINDYMHNWTAVCGLSPSLETNLQKSAVSFTALRNPSSSSLRSLDDLCWVKIAHKTSQQSMPTNLACGNQMEQRFPWLLSEDVQLEVLRTDHLDTLDYAIPRSFHWPIWTVCQRDSDVSYTIQFGCATDSFGYPLMPYHWQRTKRNVSHSHPLQTKLVRNQNGPIGTSPTEYMSASRSNGTAVKKLAPKFVCGRIALRK